MESQPYHKADREQFWNDVETAQALRSFQDREPDKAGNWLGVKQAAGKVATANGLEFTYGAGETPSEEFITLILEDLGEIGVTIRIDPLTGLSSLSGNVAQIPAALLASVKRHKESLLAFLRNRQTVFRRLGTEPELPEPLEPIEWDNGPEEFGRCLGKNLPDAWARWRYLYGARRHTWHSRTGYEWEEGSFQEPEETETEDRYKGKRARRYWPAKPKPAAVVYGTGSAEIPD